MLTKKNYSTCALIICFIELFRGNGSLPYAFRPFWLQQPY